MSRPPRAMRKGFDLALCLALRTDRETLFDRWGSAEPERAPFIDSPSHDYPPDVRRKVLAIIELLDDEGLDKLRAAGRRILSGSAA